MAELPRERGSRAWRQRLDARVFAVTALVSTVAATTLDGPDLSYAAVSATANALADTVDCGATEIVSGSTSASACTTEERGSAEVNGCGGDVASSSTGASGCATAEGATEDVGFAKVEAIGAVGLLFRELAAVAATGSWVKLERDAVDKPVTSVAVGRLNRLVDGPAAIQRGIGALGRTAEADE